MKRILTAATIAAMTTVGVVVVGGPTGAPTPASATSAKAAACYPPKVGTAVRTTHNGPVRVRHRATIGVSVGARSGTARPTGRVVVKVSRPGMRMSTERVYAGGTLRLRYNVGRKAGRLRYTVTFTPTSCSAFRAASTSGSVRLVR